MWNLKIVEIKIYRNWDLWKSRIKEIGNCGNRELWKLGLWKLEFFGMRPKCYPVCYKFYLHGHCAERERVMNTVGNCL